MPRANGVAFLPKTGASAASFWSILHVGWPCVQNGPFQGDLRACFGPFSTIDSRTCRKDHLKGGDSDVGVPQFVSGVCAGQLHGAGTRVLAQCPRPCRPHCVMRWPGSRKMMNGIIGKSLKRLVNELIKNHQRTWQIPRSKAKPAFESRAMSKAPSSFAAGSRAVLRRRFRQGAPRSSGACSYGSLA